MSTSFEVPVGGEVIPVDVIPADAVLVLEIPYAILPDSRPSDYDRTHGRQVSTYDGGSDWPVLVPPAYLRINEVIATYLEPGQYTHSTKESNSLQDRNPIRNVLVVNRGDGKARCYTDRPMRRAWIDRKGYAYKDADPRRDLVEIKH